MAAFDVERDDRRLDLRVQALRGEIVTVEGDVDQSDVLGQVEECPESFGNPERRR